MKAIVIISLFTLGTFLHGQGDYKTNFLKKWENAAAYTIECAEAMPESLYDFKPSEGSRTFKGQLIHMVNNMTWLSNEYLGAPKYEKNVNDSSINKGQLISILKETFQLSRLAVQNLPTDKMGEVVDFFAGPKEVQQIMMLMTDHMTHHRGQILVYMRMNDIKAPSYRGW